MKKIILGMFIISNLIFANWETINLVDEFKEETGQVASVSDLNQGFIKIMKLSDGDETILIYPNKYLIGKGKGEYKTSKVKFKVDSNSPITFIGVVAKDGTNVNIFKSIDTRNFSDLIEQMKVGNTLKISIYKYTDESFLRSTSLNEFTKNYNKIR